MKTKLLLFGLLLIAGCSKKDPEPEFFVSAASDGKSWAANVANSQNTPAAAIINQNLVLGRAGCRVIPSCL